MRFTALLLTLLIGQFTDKTTGQPLHGVHVDLRQGTKTLHAVTGEDGGFRLDGVKPGTHVLHYSSGDVPPSQVTITVRGAAQHVHVTACSMTLDYSCGGPGGGG
ncbi:MAG TPA: carboxypeptidase regulatory-like domain-containing protein [Candidatus Baltobacteraceae bacterium]